MSANAGGADYVKVIVRVTVWGSLARSSNAGTSPLLAKLNVLMTSSTHPHSAAPGIGVTLAFVALVVLAGTSVGLFSAPGAWYAGLEKPPFNPPNWIFAPVWTTLYVLIGTAGARTWNLTRSSSRMTLWWTQLVLNLIWSPVFFMLRQPAGALAIVIAMLAAIVAFIALSWKSDRIAAWLFVPYAAWVSFATLLNASIVFLN